MHKTIEQQNGFTLVEVLISVIILAVGLLGLASLQMISLKNNNSAQYRTEATIEAYSIVDRMRLNREVALAGGYNAAMGSVPGGPDPMAVNDVTIWQATLGNALKGGQGAIAIAGDVISVTVQWNDSRGVTYSDEAVANAARIAAKTQQFVMSTQL